MVEQIGFYTLSPYCVLFSNNVRVGRIGHPSSGFTVNGSEIIKWRALNHWAVLYLSLRKVRVQFAARNVISSALKANGG